MRRYGEINPANSRLRALINDTVDAEMWRLLWLPPTLPYYQLKGAFAKAASLGLTKRLVFSAWNVVPKVVSSLVSYAAERQIVRSWEETTENTAEERKRRSQLLRFASSYGRLTGMPVLGILYPSTTLAQLGDPLCIFRSGRGEDGTAPDMEAVLETIQERLSEALEPVAAKSPTTGAIDKAWYWAAPILLDLNRDERATREWLEQEPLAQLWAGEPTNDEKQEATQWDAHVKHAQTLVSEGPSALGRPPDDLVFVLTQIAMAGPGVSALRGLERVVGVHGESKTLRNHAAAIASGTLDFLIMHLMSNVSSMCKHFS